MKSTECCSALPRVAQRCGLGAGRDGSSTAAPASGWFVYSRGSSAPVMIGKSRATVASPVQSEAGVAGWRLT